MVRAVPVSSPAWWPAFLLFGVLLLQGCSLLPKKESAEENKPVTGLVRSGTAGAGTTASDKDEEGDDKKAGNKRDAFTVDVRGPEIVRDYLKLHLEIQRYRELDDLGATEISRLMVAAETNARELLATLGYFTPTLTLELNETPQGEKAPREIVINVSPGELTKVSNVQISYAGPIADDAAAESQRDTIRTAWALRAGQPFSQQAWDEAKTTALRSLTARRFPTGSIQISRAEVDADRSEARLSVTYQSGPAYKFGPLVLRGIQRYDPDGARRIARLPSGQDYDQQKLLDAQQRLASSGYYDSVFLTLDTESADPLAAPVIAQLREAPLQKVVLGVGFTTDNGPRLSIDHIHNQVPLLGWRAVSRLSVDNDIKSLSTELKAIPDDRGWRWFSGAELKSEQSGSYVVDSGRLRGGRSKSGDHIDRSYFLQYDYAQNRGTNAPPSASAVTANWGWTGRYFDDNATPSRGFGLALEVAAGYTLTGEQVPFTRTYARWLGVLPLGSAEDKELRARRSRLQLRVEAGAVSAKDSAQIPSTLMFLTGGDTTVRGYSYKQIGTVRADGTTVAGRYLGVASVEWQRPFVYNNKLTEWESVVFVDAGAVADKPGELKPKVGVGVGARWRSPVGPVQADLAYGVDSKKFRLHFRLGFTF
ncbi:BamA/TamA family outer membrane protein [Variovorax sp. NFACC27]|uniref:autotransporter assembly complex protein TamA n=1 Tax=unclassified Variovorax TaxID=663243 RepID=UPI0008946C50|nr:autotransporter secretion outer membrane protein TamA [Variovorax sp. NFACC28]SEG92868.1 autotransporter secretion outer membrane protein TamA [Variovorax sp. NFACC29]SFD67414.1 autotransporter secretion outer membrane protein TamA [Variovorax sp. NFACC26]SFH11386.1 autotransporter secretion outer membrane protein TamA [Variovorax sp. NFACC27]